MTERIEKILTQLLLLQLGASSQAQKIDILLRADFKNAEIAALLGTTGAVVAQTAYQARKPKKKATKKAAKKNAKKK